MANKRAIKQEATRQARVLARLLVVASISSPARPAARAAVALAYYLNQF